MIVAIWASWNVVSRYGLLHTMTPADITLVRFIAGTALTMPMLLLVRWRTVRWMRLLVITLTYGFPYTLAAFYGLRTAPAANAGIIVNGLLPLFVALYAWLLFRHRIPLNKLPAIALMIGANAVMLHAGMTEYAFNVGWVWLLVSCALIAAYMTAARAWQVNIVALLPLMSLTNLVLFAPLWLLLPHNLAQAPMEEIALQAVFQGLVNMVLVVILLTYASKRLGPVNLSVLFSFVPAATALFGLAVLGESLSGLEWAAVAACTCGLVLYSVIPLRSRAARQPA